MKIVLFSGDIPNATEKYEQIIVIDQTQSMPWIRSGWAWFFTQDPILLLQVEDP